MLEIVHVITGLGRGGAETMLFKLLSNMDRRRFSCRVVSLIGDGPMADSIRSLGVPVHLLDMKRDAINVGAIPRLAAWIRCWRPDVVQTWMYHADLAGGVAARLAGLPRIVWNIRHGDVSSGLNRARTSYVLKTCALLSRFVPARIICCSDESREAHSNIGYASSRLTTIPNGFDCELFRPDPEAGASFRKEFGIPADAPVVGIIARFHPHKDHRTFIRAAALIQQRRPDTHFVLCGSNIDRENSRITEWAREETLKHNLHLLGVRSDVPRIFAGLDIAVSTSLSEGFPNVIGEAMSCGLPCVATDAGASATLIGDTGCIVPVSHPEGIADNCVSLIDAGNPARKELGGHARQRVVSMFSIAGIARRYEQIYEEVAQCAA